MGHLLSRTGSFLNTLLMGASVALAITQFFVALPYGMNFVAVLCALVLFYATFSRTETGKNLFGYFSDARKEMKKVIWPTKQETTQSVWLVGISVISAAFFFWLADLLIQGFIAKLLYLFS